MKLRDLFGKETLTLSFEVFPPKTDTAFASVQAATEEIARLKPAFMSVTYGAAAPAALRWKSRRTSSASTECPRLHTSPVCPPPGKPCVNAFRK